MEALDRAGLARPEGARFDWDQLAWYYSFLRQNADFFSARDRDRILERHLLESIWMAGVASERGLVSRETEVLDAGTGPGLPGFVFRCLDPAPAVTLNDSSRRRLGRLQQAAAADAGLRFSYDRLEEIRHGRFDLVTIRALIPFPFCVELVAGAVREGGHVLYASAAPAVLERESIFLDALGFVSRETVPAPALSFLGSRFFYLLLKTRQTPHPYPRPWTTILKALDTWEKSSPWPTRRAE